jgi:dihydroxy-acid dehydratase
VSKVPPALNWNSRVLTDGWQRGPRAFYWGLGFQEADFPRPQVGIATPLLEGNLCNVRTAQFAQWIAEGCREAGLVGLPFGVSAVSDNICQGVGEGGASLVSRNLIANGAEMVCSAHYYDALVGLHHCDKNGPGMSMALVRLNYPGLIVNGGTILPGSYHGKPTTILDVYDAQARHEAGSCSHEEMEAIIKTACPGPGGCGIAASFNTWGIVLEALGLSLPNSSSTPAVDSLKQQECLGAGRAVRRLLELDLRPRQIVTAEGLRNAMRALAAIGGSTNGVLHLLALAREACVAFDLRDVQAICRTTPVMCNFAPRGSATMVDLHRAGGTAMLLKHLIECDLLDGSLPTVSGLSLAESVADAPPIPDVHSLIAPRDAPFREHADLQICFGNVAPDGIVFKVSAWKSTRFTGPAICFDDPREVVKAAVAQRIRPGHVVVLRYLGPVAAGMPEVHIASAALSLPPLKGEVALISDTRVSGVSSGALGVHCAPEAAVGGPLALLQDGDEIQIDLLAGTIEAAVDLEPRAVKYDRAIVATRLQRHRRYLAEFAALTTQADQGCVSRCVVEQRLPSDSPRQSLTSDAGR